MSLAEEFSKKYKKPDRYRIAPDTKVLNTFGLDMSPSDSKIKTGTIFGKSKQKLYDIICPIDVSSWNYESSDRTLLIRDDDLGFGIRINGMFTPNIGERLPRKGDFLGRAGQYLSCGTCVSVEGIILRSDFKDVLKARFETSQDEIDLGYIRSLAESEGRRYIDVKTQFFRQLRWKYKIDEINPYWFSYRSHPFAPRETFFNYLALFS